MRALVYQNNELRFTRDHSVPTKPKYNEALIRVTHAGICGTDLEITKGYMGFQGVPGHEFVGIVESCGEERFVGKRVVGEINVGCGVCPSCLNRRRNHCPNRSVLGILNKDGAFAEQLTLSNKNLHLVPDLVTDEEAVFVEPLAAAFEITQQIPLRPTDKVCVMGDGRLGLLVSQVLALTGCNLVAAGRYEEKLAIVKERGIDTTCNPDFPQNEFDVVVDCSGSAAGFDLARKWVKPRGTIVLKTTVAEREAVDLNSLVIDEVTVVGSRCGPFAPALRALAMKSVDVRPLIEKTFPLEEGVEAFHYASQKGALKVLLRI